MRKFQPGDLVVVVQNLHENDLSENSNYPQVGETVTVTSASDFRNYRGPVYWFEEKPNGRYENELELAEICKSPLWRALL